MTSRIEPWQRWLPYLAAVALAVGIYGRFAGLGYAPFAVDEYYLARSIEGVLRTGLPTFQCGGYYPRGLILQYAAAALQLAGVSPELAPRALCALSSLIALPAAYLLGRRLHGRLVGVLLVCILALSVWEIEMARFGRMYAPFQALFLWYLLFFLRHTVDREARALWPMLALSLIGPLVWEGGIFLLLTNLLPVLLRLPEARPGLRDAGYLAFGFALLAATYLFLDYDFRYVQQGALYAGFDPAQIRQLTDPLSTLQPPLLRLPSQPLWLVLFMLPLAAAAFAGTWIWTLRSRPLLALGLFVVLLVAIAHQFLLSGAVLVLLVLLRYIPLRELLGREARRLHVALGALGTFWVAFGLATLDWNALGGPVRGLAMLAYQFVKFPDLVGVVLRPWAWAVPHLGAALLVLIGIALARMARSSEGLTTERALLVVFLVLLLTASASDPPRQETRYVFNLYPLAVAFALVTIVRVFERVARRPGVVAGAATAVALGGFALTEDFQPQHLRSIDTAAATFRLRMPPAMQSHLVIRDDFRALARWLEVHVPRGATVINSVHGLDHYYPAMNYFYVEPSNPNTPDWSCRGGAVERWGNYPMLHTVESLAEAIGRGSTGYLVTFGYEREELLRSLASLHPSIAASEGAIIIIELRG